MPLRKIVLSALAATVLLPASAGAAPSVTITGDDGNPAALSTAAPVNLRNMDITVDISVPAADNAPFYTAQVLGPDNGAATPVSSCRDSDIQPTARSSVDYRGNGTYTVVIRYFGASDSDCNGTARETRFQYAVGAGSGVTAPATRLLTRNPNTFVTNTHQLGVTLNPGALGYDITYALNGAIGPDGAISGPSSPAFVDTTTGLAGFRFTNPGRYVIVARARGGAFNSPWSAPAVVNAIAPFDLERVSFPDQRGPRYKLRGQIRERAARGRVRIAIARGRRGGKFRRFGSARINRRGRFTKRFRLRRTGVYRIRYTYRGSSLVAGGRVTQRVRISRRVFF
jgi:hypothetical protein